MERPGPRALGPDRHLAGPGLRARGELSRAVERKRGARNDTRTAKLTHCQKFGGLLVHAACAFREGLGDNRKRKAWKRGDD